MKNLRNWVFSVMLYTVTKTTPFDSMLPQQYFCQKLPPKSVDVHWSHSVLHQCRFFSRHSVEGFDSVCLDLTTTGDCSEWRQRCSKIQSDVVERCNYIRMRQTLYKLTHEQPHTWRRPYIRVKSDNRDDAQCRVLALQFASAVAMQSRLVWP